MRKEFVRVIQEIALKNEKIVFITGDLGFMALEGVRDAIGKRFINAGVCEQNIVNVAAGLASEGLIPLFYSIASFAVFRPLEQIRINLCLHNMNVKIVGNGGGYGYGVMGASHHAIEDIAVLSCMQNMKCYIPFCSEDVESTVRVMMEREGPSYLRLGFGNIPSNIRLPVYSAVRQLTAGGRITVIGTGPALLGVFKALKQINGADPPGDIFAVSEMPLLGLTKGIRQSVLDTKNVLIVEEHVRHGGLGENIAEFFMEEGLSCRFSHLYARGYPGGTYGSQKYHLDMNGLSPEKLFIKMKELLIGKMHAL